MTPRNRHARTESVPHSDFGAQEFYDEDDLEELDEKTDAADLAAFDAEAIDEDEESHLLAMRERATKGGRDDPHVASGQRLQKVLAHAGVASRRACEQLIADGRVSVDGITVTEAGVRVDPLTQEIRVDGSRILTNPELITLMLHKPAGVVTTMEDPEGRPTVAQYGRDYLAEHPELPDSLRLVHVGRLDTETEGAAPAVQRRRALPQAHAPQLRDRQDLCRHRRGAGRALGPAQAAARHRAGGR